MVLMLYFVMGCFLILYEVLVEREEDEGIDECFGNRDAMIGGVM